MPEKVIEGTLESATDDFLWHIMTAFRNSGFDSGNSQFSTGDPKIEEMYTIAKLTEFLNKPQMSFA